MKVSLPYDYESFAFIGIMLDSDRPPFTQPMTFLPNLRTMCRCLARSLLLCLTLLVTHRMDTRQLSIWALCRRWRGQFSYLPTGNVQTDDRRSLHLPNNGQ